jgi:hypothetical protein
MSWRARSRRALALAVVGLCAVTWACREDQPETELPDGPAVGVVELGRIGGRIYNEPDRAREILEAAGMTPEEFESEVRAVTNDPLLAREYTRGFEAVIRPRPRTPPRVAPDSLADSVPDDSVPADTSRGRAAGQGRGER